MENVVISFFQRLMIPTENDMYNVSVINLTKLNNETFNPLAVVHNKHIAEEVLRNMRFIIGMILIPVFAFFGSIGNIFSLIVIYHEMIVQRLRNSSNICLAGLALSDLLFLFHCLLFAGINVHIYVDPFEGKNIRTMMFPYFGAYGSLVTARITTLMTLLLSVERFIAVYFPMKAKVICNQKITIISICFIYIFTVLLFLPYMFKYKVQYIVTKMNRTKAIVIPSKDAFYEIYGYAMNVIFRFLPIFLLIIMNILILLVIHKTWRRRKEISNVKSSSSGASEQHRTTRLLLTVSFIFLICILPGAINSICTHIYPEYNRGRSASDIYEFVNYITYFLETFNSSINFIIYMALSSRFCKTYKRLFCCQKNINFYSTGSNRTRLSFSHDRTSFNKEQDHLIYGRNCGSFISLDTRYTALNGHKNSYDYTPKHSRFLRKKLAALKRSHSQNSLYKQRSSLKASPNGQVRSCYSLKISPNVSTNVSSNVSPAISENGNIHDFKPLQPRNNKCEKCESQLRLTKNGYSSNKDAILTNGHSKTVTIINSQSNYKDDFV